MDGAGRGRTIRGKGVGRPLADWVEGCIAPALGRFGFGEVDIVTGWADIVGPWVAASAEPVGIRWPRRGAGDPAERSPATLVVRVEGAFALELQHLAPALIERINAHLGWRCIGRLALRQAPLRGRPARHRPLPPPPPAAVARARDATVGIADEDLRDALVRLGARTLRPGPARPG